MLLTTDSLPQAATPVRWRLGTRVAFRLCVLYFSLYVICTQMLGSLFPVPKIDLPNLGDIPPMRNLTEWVATHVFRVSGPLVITGSGSGDKTFDWVQVFCLLVISAIATIAWSYVDRARERYTTLNAWFRLFLRFALGATMVSYGMVKAIPLQMPAPGMTRLLEPYNQFSPMGVLWAAIGASRSYEIFAGASELVAGILLFIPGMTTIGALVCLAVATHVFTLNMTYDVPVKLFSFHLVVMSLVLLAPEAKRLVSALVLNRATDASTQPVPGKRPRARRIIVIAQIVFGLYVIGMNVSSAMESWTRFGGGAPKSPLYGIWNVDRMTIDGVERAPLVTDYDRWRRLTFQAPANTAFQRMDDTFARYGAKIDTAANTLTLTRPDDKTFNAQFTIQRPAPNRLILDGTMKGRAMRMETTRVDHEQFLLVSRGFHWVQEYPFNR